MALTDADLNGRKIDALFTSTTVALTSQKLFTCNQSPEIASSGKTIVLFVGLQIVSGGDSGSTTVNFGTTPGGTEWNGGSTAILTWADRPYMFYPYYFGTGRPGAFTNGTGFYFSAPAPFTANSTGIFTLYGFTY